MRPRGARHIIASGGSSIGGEELAGQFTVSRGYTAFVCEASRKGGGERLVKAFDVARGRPGFTDVVGRRDPGDPPVPDVLAFVVNAKGYTAWLTRTPAGSAIDVHGSHGPRRVDHAEANGLDNLRLDGNALSWTREGTPQSTTLG